MFVSFLHDYDYNMPLMDALGDPELPVMRRLLAGASMDVGLDNAYYSTGELVEVFQKLSADKAAKIDPKQSVGAAHLDHVLLGEGDDYQRRLFWLLSETDVDVALLDLNWLMQLLGQRASMSRVFREYGVSGPEHPGRYVETDDIGCTPFGYD